VIVGTDSGTADGAGDGALTGTADGANAWINKKSTCSGLVLGQGLKSWYIKIREYKMRILRLFRWCGASYGCWRTPWGAHNIVIRSTSGLLGPLGWYQIAANNPRYQNRCDGEHRRRPSYFSALLFSMLKTLHRFFHKFFQKNFSEVH
jgi:hypothetical protein